MKQLIINADDFGLTEGVSRAIVDLFDANAISNTTAMVTIEGAFELCQKYLNNGLSKKVGVHLTTTPENHHKQPLSKPSEIPTLVEINGTFKHQDNEEWINPDEIELEWERQILKVCDALGQTPSHLDSHHGVHRKPDLTPVYLKLAKKYNIPVRGGRTVGQIDGSYLGVQSTSLCSIEWTGKFNDLDFLKQSIMNGFDQLSKGQVLEICTHPGFCDDDLMSSSSWNECRENDYNVLLELSQTTWLEDNNIELIHFEDL